MDELVRRVLCHYFGSEDDAYILQLVLVGAGAFMQCQARAGHQQGEIAGGG
jgi:hypothetical protein